MNIRNVLAISSLALLTATPFAVRADAGPKASDACVQAFVATYLPKGQAVRVRKVGLATSPLHVYARRHTVALSAQLSGSDEVVTARCVANEDGVVSLK